MKKISTKNLAEVLYSATHNKSEAESAKIVKSFVQLLAKKRMTNKATEIIAAYKKLLATNDGIIEVEATTHEHLTAEAKKDISHSLKESLGAKQIILNEKVDANVLGGIKLKYGDTVIDGTLQGRLKQLAVSLSK